MVGRPARIPQRASPAVAAVNDGQYDRTPAVESAIPGAAIRESDFLLFGRRTEQVSELVPRLYLLGSHGSFQSQVAFAKGATQGFVRCAPRRSRPRPALSLRLDGNYCERENARGVETNPDNSKSLAALFGRQIETRSVVPTLYLRPKTVTNRPCAVCSATARPFSLLGTAAEQ